ncbi:MAG: hypothetical protein AB1486_22580 [Planctomycetota bacterium]
MRGLIIPILLLASASLAATARATEEWSRDEVAARFAEQNAPGQVGTGSANEVSGMTAVDNRLTHYPFFDGPTYPDNYQAIAAFLVKLQVLDPADPDYGGMREGEHLPMYIETDNTTESIWVWTRYTELTGDSTFVPNIEAAWQYVLSHPAYQEDGGGPYGYYSMYNCGWALTAEPAYRRVFGDSQYEGYARLCADHVLSNPLELSDLLNRFSEAFAIGALYRFAIEQGNPAYESHALTRGGLLKAHVESSPAQLGRETWALSGGTLFWGIVESVWAANPEGRQAWVDTYDNYLDTYDPAGTWHTAHNGWYALAHAAAWSSTASAEPKGRHRFLVELLLAQDGDNDGGIPAEEDDSDDEDQSWVTNYLAFMGLHPVDLAIDVEVEPATYTIPDGGTLMLDLGVSHNLPDAGLYFLIAFLAPPSSGPMLLGFCAVFMQPKSEVAVPDCPLPFPPGSPLGEWQLELSAYDLTPSRVDREVIQFVVQ